MLTRLKARLFGFDVLDVESRRVRDDAPTKHAPLTWRIDEPTPSWVVLGGGGGTRGAPRPFSSSPGGDAAGDHAATGDDERVDALTAAGVSAPRHVVVHRFGQKFVWTARHTPSAALEALRAHGDPLADAVLDALEGPGPREDVLEALERRCPALAALQPGAAASADDASGKDEGAPPDKKAPPACFGEFAAHAATPPAWVDWERVALGQTVFLRHAHAAGPARGVVAGRSPPCRATVTSERVYFRAVETATPEPEPYPRP